MGEEKALTPANTTPPGKRPATLVYLALGIAIFAVVAAWDFVFLALWGKN